MIGFKFWLGKVAKTWRQLLVTGGTVLALGACGPGLDSLAPFSIGGTVSGLTGTLVLQNNGGDNLSLTGNGNFIFKTELANASAYVVTVLTQPVDQFCTVNSGTGAATGDVTTVAVQCTWTGTKQFGATQGSTFGYSVATDTSGNVFVAGTTTGIMGNNLGTVGATYLFVTRYDSSGVKQGTVQLGGGIGTGTYGNSIATDASGNVYVTGSTTGALTSTPRMGDTDFFVAKFDNTLLASPAIIQLGGVTGTNTESFSIATDASGVYVTGYTTADLNNSNNTLTGDYAFAAKFDKDLLTAPVIVQLGVSGASTNGKSITTNATGIYVAGFTTGDLNNQTVTTDESAFVAKLDKNNLTIPPTIVQLGLSGTNSRGNSITTNAGGVYLAGSTNGALDGLFLNGDTDFFVTKFDSNLANPLTVQLGVSLAVSEGNSIATDANGNVFVAGTTNGLLGNASTGGSDFFVAKYSGNLGLQFVQQLGATGSTTLGSAVTTDVSGNVYVAGTTDGVLDSTPRTVVKFDAFVTKYHSGSFK